MRYSLLFLLLLPGAPAGAAPAGAAPAAKPKPAKMVKRAAAPAAKAGATPGAWTEWYLVSKGGQALAYFEENLETRPKEKQLAVTQKWVEQFSGRSELYIGSVSSLESLEPVAFFVERKGAKAYKIDGRVIEDARFEITFKPADPGLTNSTERTPLRRNMILSSFLGLAAARKLAEGRLEFTALVEDAGDMNVEIKKGVAEALPATRSFGAEKCRQLRVQWDGQVQNWWIAANGKVCLVEFPASGVKMELSSEKAAKGALRGGK